MSDETPKIVGVSDATNVSERIEGGLNRVEILLRVYCMKLEKLMARLLEDDVGSAEVEKQINKLEGVLKALNAAESRYDEFKSKRTGAAGQFALDLDEARLTIGERLSRLRRAGQPREVPG